MNQILQVQDKKNKKINKTVDTKKIVLFFAISIIIFGLIMLIEGIYHVSKNKTNQKVDTPIIPETTEPEYVPPTIVLTRIQEDKLIINIESQIAISHIIYNWNNESSKTLEETGKTNIEEIIDIPVGENIFNMSVIDTTGKETKKTETYIVEVIKPEIEFSVIGNNIKINITSKNELSYIAYKWNSDPEQKSDMITYEDKTKFDKQLEIPKGQNTLKIIAVDINGNKAEESKIVEGVPKAKTTTIAREEYIYFTVTSETYDIKSIEYEFNGEKFTIDTNTFGQTKKVEHKLKMVEGWNYLKVISSLQKEGVDTKDTTVWKIENEPQ